MHPLPVENGVVKDASTWSEPPTPPVSRVCGIRSEGVSQGPAARRSYVDHPNRLATGFDKPGFPADMLPRSENTFQCRCSVVDASSDTSRNPPNGADEDL